MEVKEFSCCKKEKSSVSCCPQMKDDSCASETTDIQFNFETLVAFFQFDFKQMIVLLNTFYLYDRVFHLNWYTDYPEGVPLLKIYKPELAELQRFLL